MPHCPSTCTSRRPESLVSPPVSRTPTGCAAVVTVASGAALRAEASSSATTRSFRVVRAGAGRGGRACIGVGSGGRVTEVTREIDQA